MKKLDELQGSVDAIQKQDEISGLLTPGVDPTPPNACDGRVPHGMTLVILGNSVAYGDSPSVQVLGVDGRTMITMEKTAGGIAVSAEFFRQ